MNNRRTTVGLGVGCLLLSLFGVAILAAAFVLPGRLLDLDAPLADPEPTQELVPEAQPQVQDVEPLPTPPQDDDDDGVDLPDELDFFDPDGDLLPELYQELNPGVVNIQVFTGQGFGGVGAGSGFILDDDGHIVTNNHVVAGAEAVTVIFFNGIQAAAEIIATDPDSDLAVVRVDGLPEEVHPLPVSASDDVEVGDWVLAIGNPFGLGSSMTLGIVSAIGRTIGSGATPFSIPQAIQTDAAINPGNSGGPLLSLDGEVIGVNAQIATGGTPANAGVGFAIPANVVRLVVPVLLTGQPYAWPWLGVQGSSVTLPLAEANELESQYGAYLHQITPDSPAAEAGLQGSTGTSQVNGLTIPVGGDVVVAIDGVEVRSFDELLTQVAFNQPGETVTLTVLRNGQREDVPVTLAPRPANVNPEVSP